jgi:hypothetical protein
MWRFSSGAWDWCVFPSLIGVSPVCCFARAQKFDVAGALHCCGRRAAGGGARVPQGRSVTALAPGKE